MNEQWTSDAKKVTRISLVAPDGFPEPSTAHSFHPDLTYQLFENDSIYGYGNLSVDLKFRQDDMSPALDVRYDTRLSEAGASDTQVPIDNVEEVLQKHLPEDTPTQLDLSDSSFTPPGKLVNTYTRGSSTYEIYHSNLADPQARALIHRMQILVLFFIEAGSAIDTDEDDEWLRNRWDVFFLYERLPGSKFSFVGYCTVHKYWYFSPSPDKHTGDFSMAALQTQEFPRQYRARISQFLVLPPFQKKGHARDLYAVIIQEYLASSDIKEITVEDPSERFEELRDVADFKRLKANNVLSGDNVPYMLLQRQQDAKDWIEAQRAIAKMPLRQFQRMIEMLLLERILLSNSDDDQYTFFVKERLYRHNKDILMQLERDERAEKLKETYLNVYTDYERLLEKVGSDAVVGRAAPARKVISGKRPAGNISTIVEGEEEEEEEELEPPSKKARVRKED
ncbi:hypothetical protein H072_7931 [Dactylellina haptotyla CBS 200.50]|uniref:Histone acetyltransferase type B catalytic subunit n=1 Tax=Dactylellina haptotyla (strain CBS 200.50) TaxID=1284197 RepID=S8A5R0_DACHA|nr:hypothetical protein H072_7931 [Dactylellina haptotyla CBS 200.50]